MAFPFAPINMGPEQAECDWNGKILNEAPVSTKKLFPLKLSCKNIKPDPVPNDMAVQVAAESLAGGGGCEIQT